MSTLLCSDSTDFAIVNSHDRPFVVGLAPIFVQLVSTALLLAQITDSLQSNF